MQIHELSQACEHLTAYFGSKPINADKLSAWFEMVEHVSVADLDSAVSEVKKNEDYLPRNFPKFILARQNPQAGSSQDQAGCPECIAGWLFAEKNGYHYAFPCLCSGEQGAQNWKYLNKCGFTRRFA